MDARLDKIVTLSNELTKLNTQVGECGLVHGTAVAGAAEAIGRAKIALTKRVDGLLHQPGVDDDLLDMASVAMCAVRRLDESLVAYIEATAGLFGGANEDN